MVQKKDNTEKTTGAREANTETTIFIRIQLQKKYSNFLRSLLTNHYSLWEGSTKMWIGRDKNHQSSFWRMPIALSIRDGEKLEIKLNWR